MSTEDNVAVTNKQGKDGVHGMQTYIFLPTLSNGEVP